MGKWSTELLFLSMTALLEKERGAEEKGVAKKGHQETESWKVKGGGGAGKRRRKELEAAGLDQDAGTPPLLIHSKKKNFFFFRESENADWQVDAQMWWWGDGGRREGKKIIWDGEFTLSETWKTKACCYSSRFSQTWEERFFHFIAREERERRKPGPGITCSFLLSLRHTPSFHDLCFSGDQFFLRWEHFLGGRRGEEEAARKIGENFHILCSKSRKI